jgi:hypothetical protein
MRRLQQLWRLNRQRGAGHPAEAVLPLGSAALPTKRDVQAPEFSFGTAKAEFSFGTATHPALATVGSSGTPEASERDSRAAPTALLAEQYAAARDLSTRIVRVTAGPGSGKTRTLVARVQALVQVGCVAEATARVVWLARHS